MNKLFSILKFPFHIIYLIVVNIFKGVKYFFSAIIPSVFKFFKILINGIISLFKGLIKEIILLFKEFINGTIFVLKKLVIISRLLFRFISYIIRSFIREGLILIRNILSGLVWVSNFMYSSVILNIFHFIIKIPIYIKNASIAFYKKFIERFVREFIDIFRYSVLGLYLLFMGIFYDAPRYLIKTVPILVKNFVEHLKDQFTLFKQWLKDLPDKLKNNVTDIFNNSIFIKNYRNKKLLQFENLTELQIDKNSEDAVRSENKITFRYLVKNADGKFIKGYFSAFSKLDCHSYLLDEGYEVYKIETSKWIEFLHGDRKYFNVKMKRKDLIFWLTQLSTYIKSGVPLTDAAKILAAQDKRKKYKKIYDELIYELTMGESFAKALEKQVDVFPPLLINMVKAAEMMGEIEYTLDDMAAYYTDIESTKKEVKSAMTYPAIVGVFSIVIIIFILTYVIPQFVSIYNSQDMEMNALTLLVIKASDFLSQSWWLLLLIIFGVIIGFIFMYKNLKAFKTLVQYVLMHLPVIGKVMIYNEMVLFSKTFASLQKNNVLLTDSIDILSKITNNEIYKVIMLDTITNLLKGDKMSDSFKDNWAIPELAYYMISTGERTGELGPMLEKVSKYYQEQQKNMVTVLKAFIEPLMIAFLALIVGGILIAAIMPMFSMYGQLM